MAENLCNCVSLAFIESFLSVELLDKQNKKSFFYNNDAKHFLFEVS